MSDVLCSEKNRFSRREVWDTVIEDLLDQILQRAFHQAHYPVLCKTVKSKVILFSGTFSLEKKIRHLQKGVDKVNKKLKDPVEGSKTRDINVDVSDVADRKVGELQPSPVGKVHLETKK